MIAPFDSVSPTVIEDDDGCRKPRELVPLYATGWIRYPTHGAVISKLMFTAWIPWMRCRAAANSPDKFFMKIHAHRQQRRFPRYVSPYCFAFRRFFHDCTSRQVNGCVVCNEQQIRILGLPEFEPPPFEAEFGRHYAFFYPGCEFPGLKTRIVAQGATVMEAIRPTPFERYFFRDANGYYFEIIDRDGYVIEN